MNWNKFKKKTKKIFSGREISLSFVLLLLIFVNMGLNRLKTDYYPQPRKKAVSFEERPYFVKVLPRKGFLLPIKWGTIGPKLVEIGVIDLDKFEKSANLTDEQKEILTRGSDREVYINSSNSHFMVNFFWAVGLAQKSFVYEKGPMGMEYKDKVSNLASTGGWTLGKKEAGEYLGRYELFSLTPGQKQEIWEISQNVYRPCCDNPTSFPDCNHGMAALGLIALMVSEGFSKEEIYKTLLYFNSFWFPQDYLTVAEYFYQKGQSWEDLDPKILLGREYSSLSGATKISQSINPVNYEKGGSCST